MNPDLKDLLSLASEAAYLGGRRTLGYFNTGITPDTKLDNTPVTLADREAEKVIRDCITSRYPHHSLLGEEFGRTDTDAEVRWIIDPIDGTKTFLCGVPMWGSLIGVEVKGEPVVGVIYIPALDEMVAAAKGLGATWNGRPAHVSTISNLAESRLLTTSAATAMARSDAYENLSAKVKLNRGWGDCYGYALVATGRADIMLDSIVNPWDIAPMLPIMEEAGGKFTDWQGNRTTWGKDSVATNAALNGAVLEVLGAERKRA